MQKEKTLVQKQALRAQAESAFLLNLGFIVSLFYTVSFGVLGMPMSLKALEIHKDYRYDALGRLSDVIDGQSGAVLEHYEYDGVGNLLLKVLNGARYTYTYDAAHQLKSMEAPDGLHTYDYDTAGRLIAEYLNGKAVVRYHYGYLDKVIAVERDGATTRYLYDAEGNLATKIYPDGRHENYAWDGMALILKGDTVYINEPHASGGLPIASTTNGVTTYHSYDALGTSIADYDEAGNPIKRYESTAYGEGTIQADTTGSARFTGKLYDAEMAAYIFPFRNYDPVIVRWRSSDPIGFPDGPNNHYYAAVPTMQIDPWGLWKLELSTNVGFPNGENFELSEGIDSINVPMYGYYNAKLTRENGDIGSKTIFFDIIGTVNGEVICRYTSNISVLENEEDYSLNNYWVGANKKLKIGEYNFQFETFVNYGGLNFDKYGNAEVGSFSIINLEN